MHVHCYALNKFRAMTQMCTMEQFSFRFIFERCSYVYKWSYDSLINHSRNERNSHRTEKKRARNEVFWIFCHHYCRVCYCGCFVIRYTITITITKVRLQLPTERIHKIKPELWLSSLWVMWLLLSTESSFKTMWSSLRSSRMRWCSSTLIGHFGDLFIVL